MIRKLEAVVIVMLVYALLFSRSTRTWIALTALAAVLQIVMEGMRFHFVPVWLSIACLLLSHWHLRWLFSTMAVLLLILSVALIYALPLVALPAPRGKYLVGVRHEYWSSASDDDGRQRLYSARIWYPAYVPPGSGIHVKRAKMFGPHWRQILKYMARQVGPAGLLLPLMHHVRFIHTHAYENAELARVMDIGTHPLPVLLFSHGLYGLPELYASLCEGIASFGFVVAAVHHTDGSSFVLNAEGRVEHPFRPLPATAATQEQALGFRYQQVNVRLRDLQELLQHLRRENTRRWGGRLALDRVGVLGHSFGGATTLEALARLPDAVAGVALDTWIEPVRLAFGASQAEQRALADRPLHLLNSDLYFQTPAWLERMHALAKRFQWRVDTLKGSVHHSFVDFPGLFVAPLIGRRARYVGTQPPVDLVCATVQTVVDDMRAALSSAR